jgi:hypothetical protein
MTKSLTKLLAIPALLAGVVQGLQFLNDIPVDGYYEEGTEFVLEWIPETRTDTFELTLDTFLSTPVYVGPGSWWTGPIYDFMTVSVVLDG